MKNRIKNYFTKMLALCLAVLLLAVPASAFSIDDFTDVPGDAWYRPELETAVENDLLADIADDSFCEDENMSRGQFVTIAGRIFGEPAEVGSKFVDVSANAYYAPYVYWAYENGIVNGVSTKEFEPEGTLTREQMATIVSRSIGNLKLDLEVVNAAPRVYKDESKISDWADVHVDTCWTYGIMKGDNNDEIRPADPVIRSEGMAVLIRLGQNSGKLHKHEYVVSKTVPPTCEAEGTTTYTCVCGKSYRETTEALGHDYKQISEIAPTENADGSKTYECGNCGKRYTEVVPKHVHEWLLERGMPRNIYNEGYRIYSCSCGATYKEVFPKFATEEEWVAHTDSYEHDHPIIKRVIPATKNNEGYRLYTCDGCGLTMRCVIAKLGSDAFASYNSKINYSEARRAGIAYAESFGFMIDESLNWDNSGYYGSTWSNIYNSTEELIQAVYSDIDYLVKKTVADGSLVSITRYNCLIDERKMPVISGGYFVGYEMQTMIASAYG